MAEAVVDDLEAVEVEIERRESAADAPLLELVEPAPEPLHEDRAVAQARSADRGIRRCCEPLLCDRSLRRVGQRSRDADRAPAGAAHRDTAAQEPPVGAVLVADPVLVLKVIRLAGEMRLERRLERDAMSSAWTRSIHSSGRTDAGGRGQAEHRPPSAREVELLAPKIPLPQPVIRAFRGEREPLFASLERVFRARSLRDVMPEQRHAAGNGEDSDLQNPRTRGGRQPKMRERPRAPIGQRHR